MQYLSISLMNPCCSPLLFTFVSSSSLRMISASKSFAMVGRRLMGRYDFAKVRSLPDPLGITTILADFQHPGKTAVFMHSLMSSVNCSPITDHDFRSMEPVIPSKPGALFGFIHHMASFTSSMVNLRSGRSMGHCLGIPRSSISVGTKASNRISAISCGVLVKEPPPFQMVTGSSLDFSPFAHLKALPHMSLLALSAKSRQDFLFALLF